MIKVGKEIAQKENFITAETKKLVEERRNLSRDVKRKSTEYIEINKTFKKRT